MSDDFDDSYDPYGDTDQHNVPDGGAGQDTTAGDGLPGYPVDGLPGVRAGVFGSGQGLLGMARTSDLVARPGDDATLQFGTDQGFGGRDDGGLLLASDMPSAYMPDGHGGVQLRPDVAATRPKGPFDFGGMAKEIDWPGVAMDLGKIGVSAAAGVALPFIPSLLGFGAAPAEAVGAAGSGATPNPWMTGAALAWRGGRTLHNQDKANPKNADPVVKPDVDKASNGLP